MKNIIIIFSLISLLCTASFDAQARKKFGSKKHGKTPETQQTAKKQQTDTNTLAPAAKPKSSKKGMMAGIFGGLLAGGLIAAMMGDDFEGMQLLEIILMAGIALIIFKLVIGMIRRNSTPAMAHAQGAFTAASPMKQTATAHAANSGFNKTNDVPFNLPDNFDTNSFLEGARSHYQTLQTAWNNADYTIMAEYLSPELVAEFKAEREAIDHVSTQVMFIDAELVRADTDTQKWQISVRFTGKYRDLSDEKEQPILEIWHLERAISDDAPWLIVGVEDLIDA